VQCQLQVQGNEKDPHRNTKQMASELLHIQYSLLIFKSLNPFSLSDHHQCSHVVMIKRLLLVSQRLKDWIEQAIRLNPSIGIWYFAYGTMLISSLHLVCHLKKTSSTRPKFPAKKKILPWYASANRRYHSIHIISAFLKWRNIWADFVIGRWRGLWIA